MNKGEILVTGGRGFIGSHLIARLGDKATTLDRNIVNIYDINELIKAFENKKIVVHLAGATRGDFLSLSEINLMTTVRILEAISRIKGAKPRLIFASTFAVYASQSDIVREETLLEPRNQYGLTKLWCEQAITYCIKNMNLKAAILRFSNVYGEGMMPNTHSVVSTFAHNILTEQELVINGDGSQVRDFVHVEDVVEAMINIIERESLLENLSIINICSGGAISLRELICKLETLVGKKSRVSYNTSVKESGYWIGDNHKARQILSWKPKIDIDSGLVSTLAWLKNQYLQKER